MASLARFGGGWVVAGFLGVSGSACSGGENEREETSFGSHTSMPQVTTEPPSDDTTGTPSTSDGSSSTGDDTTGGESTEHIGVCGDGMIDEGEECDDGNIDDTDECLTACVAASCGDGFVQVNVEVCDDGDDDDTDECVSTCKLASCGDGFVQTDVEVCDDGNDELIDGCTPACAPESIGTATYNQMQFGKAIPDNAYDGGQASMACVDLVIPGGTVITAKLQVIVAHPWIGDLTFKLFSPNNTKSLTMLSMPGFAEAADNGASMSSEGSDLPASYIVFRDAGVKDAEQMGNTIDNTQAVCLDDDACDYKPNRGAATGLLNFAGFAGISSQGKWQFCVADSVASNAGTLKFAKLSVLVQ